MIRNKFLIVVCYLRHERGQHQSHCHFHCFYHTPRPLIKYYELSKKLVGIKIVFFTLEEKSLQSRGRKGNKTGNSVADEHSIVTTAEIHVDGDIAENCSSTNDLIRKMYTQMQHNFATLNKRFESLETTLEKKLTDKMHKAVDKRISDETVKVKRDLDNRLADMRKEFESDVDELTEKFQSLSNHFESSQQSQNGNGDERNHIKHNIVLRGLPETSGENVSYKVNSIFKYGLKLKDIEVHSAERKRSFNEGRPGVVIAKMKSMDDKKKVMTKKASLKDNRRYQNVYIYSDQTREERLMSANFRSLISAYKSGDNNIRVRETRIISDQNRTDFESMEDDQPRPSYQHSRRQERTESHYRDEQSSRYGSKTNRGRSRDDNRDRTDIRCEQRNRSNDYEPRRYNSSRDNSRQESRSEERQYSRRPYRNYKATAGFWNVRGWNTNPNSDNAILRSACIKALNLEIIGIAETHLLDNNTISVEGFRWYGQNRTSIHVHARTGSGGVGFSVKESLLEIFNVQILDSQC